MRKFTGIIAILALSAAMAACGSKNAENVETESAAVSGTGSGSSDILDEDELYNEEPADLPEDYEPEFFEGIITYISGTKLTVQDESGATMRFDMTYAETGEDLVLTGCSVEVEYAVVEDYNFYPAASVTILMDIEQQADIENRDPVIYGILQVADTNELSIIDDAGIVREFDNQMSRTVSFEEIKAGDRVAVTYVGELFASDEDDDEEDGSFRTPYALKIVAEDAIESDEAKANYISGIADKIYDDDIVTLLTGSLEFEVHVDSSMIEGIEEGDNVRVYYTGALSGITVDATSVEKD